MYSAIVTSTLMWLVSCCVVAQVEMLLVTIRFWHQHTMTRVDSLLLAAMLHVHLYDSYHLLQSLSILPLDSKVNILSLCFLLMCCFPSVYSIRFISTSVFWFKKSISMWPVYGLGWSDSWWYSTFWLWYEVLWSVVQMSSLLWIFPEAICALYFSCLVRYSFQSLSLSMRCVCL